MKSDNSNSTTRKCNQCGSDLIVKETKTEKLERSFSATTVTSFICSNKVCQDEIDKRTAKRIEIKQEQDLARQRRLGKIDANNQPIVTEKLVA